MMRPRTRTDASRAFTLVEVLLVLALLVIVAGMAWATLQRPMARQRLRSAADEVRSQWCAARIDAMKSGHTFAFRYLVHGDRYHLAAQDDTEAATSTSAPPSSSAAPSSTTAQTAESDDDELGDDPLPPPVDKVLPQGIRFLPADGNNDLAAMGDNHETGPADNSGDWSDPIYFYADGSTSDARLSIASDRHAAMRLQLRGITGSVTVDDNTAMTQ